MRQFWNLQNLLWLVVTVGVANSYTLVARQPLWLWLIVPLFLAVNLLAGCLHLKVKSRRLKICYHGGVLLYLFVLSAVISAFFHIVHILPAGDFWRSLWSVVYCIAAEFLLFWNGILCVYGTSLQLGIKWRVIGALVGMIPLANLIALGKILSVAMEEVRFEAEKERLNEQRKEARVCGTRYPLLLVHGVFFRDVRSLNYWGRIPAELEENGARIFYGEHDSAASVAESAEALAARIREIVRRTGCGKVNIIAHSKGGLDCRYALAHCGIAPLVASLTTINTPHHGCLFADYLLEIAPVSLKERVAAAYNTALKKLGDSDPDFLGAVGDLTAAGSRAAMAEATVPETVFCQSIGSRLNRAAGGKFPLNFTYYLANYFDGPNDGLVSESSFNWSDRVTILTVNGNRGISHGDMIDLNRENIPGFDVREFYVGLVHDLKERGL